MGRTLMDPDPDDLTDGEGASIDDAAQDEPNSTDNSAEDQTESTHDSTEDQPESTHDSTEDEPGQHDQPPDEPESIQDPASGSTKAWNPLSIRGPREDGRDVTETDEPIRSVVVDHTVLPKRPLKVARPVRRP